MIFFCVLVVSLFLSLVLQEFLPPLAWIADARIYLLPIVFFYAALAMPFSVMLLLAFFTGLMWDALTVQIVGSSVEIALGWSILLYAALGSIMSGFRPLFQRGRWEVHCLLSGLFCSVMVLATYLMICLRRGSFEFSDEVWLRVLGTGLAGVLLSPVIFFIFGFIASLTGYELYPAKRKRKGTRRYDS